MDPRRTGRRCVMCALGAAVLLPQTLLAAPQSYRLLPQASRVSFTFLLAGLPQRGRIPVLGARIRLDLADLRRSQAEIRLDASGARAGTTAATRILRGPAILHTARYPIIRYRARRVQPGDRTAHRLTARIVGDLTLRHTTRSLILHASLQPPPGSAPQRLETWPELSVSLRGQLSRAAFGAGGYQDLVADRVLLTILTRLRRAG